MLSLVIFQSEFIIIACVLLVIKRHHDLHPVLISGIGIGGANVLVLLKLTIMGAAKLLESSWHSCEPEKIWTPLRERKIIRNGRPMKMRIGGAVDIGRDTFPNIMNDIIIDSVMNLLVTISEVESAQ